MLKPFVAVLMTPVALESAHAQITVEISKITCEQFNVMPKGESVAVWLSGYYHGKRGDSVIDMTKFDEKVRDLRAACRVADNFKQPIMQFIESRISK